MKKFKKDKNGSFNIITSREKESNARKVKMRESKYAAVSFEWGFEFKRNLAFLRLLHLHSPPTDHTHTHTHRR